MSNQLSVGESLVELLADYGVELVFGIPGTHSIELYRGLGTGKIRHISPRHEQGGGFMADGYARVSGRPGVCFVITGAGVTNLTTPMGEAYMDSVPLLIISPVNDPDPDNINRGRLHEITSQSAVTAPLTAFSVTISDASELPKYIAQAFDIFSSERPRPVHISIPLSIIPQKVDQPWQAATPAQAKTASSDQVTTVCKLIGKSESPVLLVGGGTTSGASEIQNLAYKINCPVITTVAGRGVIPGDHPLSVGAQLRAPYVQDVLESADLAIFLGTEMGQTDHWNDNLKIPSAQIWVNLCPHALDRDESAVTILADCNDFAHRLAGELPEPDSNVIEAMYERCEKIRSQHKSDFTPKEHKHWKVMSEVMSHIPDHTTIVSDMTQIAYTSVDYLPMNRPNQWLHPTGYGTLGYALPAAIGAVLADESKSALVLVGDGGLQYTMQEMTLASELGLNIVILLWNNDALLQIYDDMNNANIKPVGVIQKNPDFIALANACGWQASQTEGLATLGADLKNAFEQSGPVLLKLDESSV